MKLVELRCPSCGAQLNADADNMQAICKFCGSTFPLDDEVRHVRYDNAGQAGYEFEMGRLRAQAEVREQEARQRQPQHPTYTLTEEERLRREKSERVKRGCLWAFGWLFFFPVPLSIVVFRALQKKGLERKTCYLIVAAMWVVLSILSAMGKSGNPKTM